MYRQMFLEEPASAAGDMGRRLPRPERRRIPHACRRPRGWPPAIAPMALARRARDWS